MARRRKLLCHRQKRTRPSFAPSIRRFYEALTEGDLDTISDLLAPDFVDHRPLQGHEDAGRKSYARFVAAVHAVFSDVFYVVEEQMAAEGDRVISRLSTGAVHDRGEFMGFAPTGKEYEMTAIVIHRIRGGQDRRGVGRGNERLGPAK